MTRERFKDRRFGADALARIERINGIVAEYAEAGYTLTVRQLYYQLVSRDVIANNVREYKNLVDLTSEARLTGRVDWEAIEDRTRSIHEPSSWSGPESIIDACVRSYQRDLWRNQKVRAEVWCEKEALAGVFAGVCNRLRIGYFSCRGYVSQSEMYEASKRFLRRQHDGQATVLLHFGDHDPSGLDMSRDIYDRLTLFGASVDFRRVALNMAQVDEHHPPPNPAKATDARFGAYQEEFGNDSWELDALPPDVLVGLVDAEVSSLLNHEAYAQEQRREDNEREQLRRVHERWIDVVELVRE